MRYALICCLILLSVTASAAQSSFVHDGSIGAVKKDSAAIEPLPTVEPSGWVGMKFIFLPQPPSMRQSGYQPFEPRLRYDQWVGKVMTVVEVASDIPPKVTFRTEDGKLLKATAYDGDIPGLAPLRDLEYARTRWLGKTLWLRGAEIRTWDEATEEFGSIKLRQYAPVQVADVVASSSNSSPVRFILKTPAGEIGFCDVNLSGTNISKMFRPDQQFFDQFYESDPRLTHVWPKAVWDAIETQSVFVGMTAEQALFSWGTPNARHATVTARGSEEQWVYANGRYLYVSGGLVTAIQN